MSGRCTSLSSRSFLPRPRTRNLRPRSCSSEGADLSEPSPQSLRNGRTKGRNLPMAREVLKRETMNTANARTDYVGAYLEDEHRLMLVAVDPAEPWEAFRKMRRALRRTKKAEQATLALFETEAPIDHSAEVISLSSRRRAG